MDIIEVILVPSDIYLCTMTHYCVIIQTNGSYRKLEKRVQSETPKIAIIIQWLCPSVLYILIEVLHKIRLQARTYNKISGSKFQYFALISVPGLLTSLSKPS